MQYFLKKIIVTFIFLFIYCSSYYAITLKGTVLDKATNKPLIGVNIVVLKTLRGTTTNTKGNFQLNLSEGIYKIRFSIVGYKSITKTILITNKNSKPISIFLEQQPFSLKGVVVESKRESNFITANYELSERTIKNVPAFVESDVMRAVAVLPGIVNYNDFKGAVSIRGSSPDQTQVLYDGMEIYYPWHLFGALGSFNMQPIKKVQVFTGGFPSEYGSRAGGIIDIASKEFNGNSIFNVNISLLTSSIFYNNRFGKLEVLLSARKTYLDILSQFFYRIPYGYVDSNLKLRYLLNDHWQFELLGYVNNDFFTTPLDEIKNPEDTKFRISDFFKNFFAGTLNWGNRTIGLKTKYFTKDFNAQLFFYNSQFSMDFPKFIDNNLNDITLKLDGSYFLNSKILLQFGTEYKKIKTINKWKFNDKNLLDIFPAGNTPVNTNIENNFATFYSGINWIYKNLDIKTGMRFTNTPISNYLEPRLALKYNFTEEQNIFATAGRYTQFLTSPFENQEFTIGNPLILADNPLDVFNFSFGTEQKLTALINSKVEFYYKEMNNLPLDINNTLKNIKVGKAKTFGLDVFVHKNVGYFTWQLAYSFLKTEGEIKNKSFPLDWEISHNISLLAGLNFSKGWYSNFGFSFHTGLPYTPVISSFYGISKLTGSYGNKFIYGERNSLNYPNYIRLDFSLSKKYSWNSFDLVLNIQIINFLYRNNIIKANWGEYYFSDFYYDYEGNKVRQGITNGIPILPSVGIELYFK